MRDIAHGLEHSTVASDAPHDFFEASFINNSEEFDSRLICLMISRKLFVAILLISFLPPCFGQENESLDRRALVIRRWANVRSRPTTASTVIRRAYEGEEFAILEEREGWIKIQLDEASSAWIFGELVEIIEEEQAGDVNEGPTRLWVYVPVVGVLGALLTFLVYIWMARDQRVLDYSDRLDRMTSAGYIDNVSRDDVVRLTRAFGIGERTARKVARQTYLDRYRVSSAHRRLTEKEKASFRKLQLVLQLGDAEVMRLMAKVYKVKGKGDRRGNS